MSLLEGTKYDAISTAASRSPPGLPRRSSTSPFRSRGDEYLGGRKGEERKEGEGKKGKGRKERKGKERKEGEGKKGRGRREGKGEERKEGGGKKGRGRRERKGEERKEGYKTIRKSKDFKKG